jgi:hypothetical protein
VERGETVDALDAYKVDEVERRRLYRGGIGDVGDDDEGDADGDEKADVGDDDEGDADGDEDVVSEVSGEDEGEDKSDVEQ